MVNVYVHLNVCGLPGDALLDDELVEAIWRELPDAGLGAQREMVTVTLSQFAVSTDRAVNRQVERTRRALAAIGYPGARVDLDEVVRDGWRDDVAIVTGAVRWYTRRALSRA